MLPLDSKKRNDNIDKGCVKMHQRLVCIVWNAFRPL